MLNTLVQLVMDACIDDEEFTMELLKEIEKSEQEMSLIDSLISLLENDTRNDSVSLIKKKELEYLSSSLMDIANIRVDNLHHIFDKLLDALDNNLTDKEMNKVIEELKDYLKESKKNIHLRK